MIFALRGNRLILVDKALHRRQEEGRPIRAALIGAGFIGRGIALQILSAVSGIRLSVYRQRRAEAGLRRMRKPEYRTPASCGTWPRSKDCIAAVPICRGRRWLLAAQAAPAMECDYRGDGQRRVRDRTLSFMP
jgi:hypothetical protein